MTTKDERERALEDARRLRTKLGFVSVPLMRGDNLAVTLCTEFDNPDQEADGDTGWTPDAIEGCDTTLDAIHALYAPTIAAFIAEAKRAEELEALVKAGRHGFNDINPHGKTILDFMNHWLDDEKHRRAKAEAKVTALEEENERMKPLAAKREDAWLVGAPHTSPEECAFWYDCCHCTVENFAAQVETTQEYIAKEAATQARHDARVEELERENERLRKTYADAEERYEFAETRLSARREENATLTARIEKLEVVLRDHANLYCEGWCKEGGGYFDDCSGCPARAALTPTDGKEE